MTTQDAAADAERLQALFELDLLRGEPLPELDRLVGLVAEICETDLASFTVHDAQRAYEVSATFGTRGTMPGVECLCGVPLAEGRTVAIHDARADPRTAKARYATSEPFVRSFAGAPVGADARVPIGVLAIGHVEPGRFGPREVARLERVAGLVSAFLLQRREAIRAKRAAVKTEEERQRQAQFELIVEAIQEGVIVYDRNDRTVEANPAACEIVGAPREQMIGLSYVDSGRRICRQDGSVFAVEDYPVWKALRFGETSHGVELVMDNPDGSRRWLSINAAPIRNPATDEIDFAVATLKDITSERSAEERLNAQNARLAEALEAAEKANRAKTDFMGVMSHELRTPMNAVLSCVQLLSQTDLSAVQRRTLGVLEDAGRQMLALLNDLLDLSSINAQKVRIDKEPVSLVRLIEDAAVIWAADIRAKGLTLSVMVDPALVAPRMVDPARLLQIIGNIVSNAIKFTSKGGITIQAWPEGRKTEAGGVAIEVEDTGPGVPPEAVERIFSPFEQADVSSKRRHGGLGLGLFVARRLAMEMGGDIAIETEMGHGSRFTVHIDAPLAPEAALRPAAAAGPADEAAPKDILCIDDNPRNLYVLGAMLRAAGHRPTEVASGAEALEQLARKKFDVVLLDMVMPEMDGMDVLAKLRAADGPNRGTPVFACTANVLPDQVEGYRNAGTAGVLAKPIDIKAVLQAVAATA